jgi:hypothetical protein
MQKEGEAETQHIVGRRERERARERERVLKTERGEKGCNTLQDLN